MDKKHIPMRTLFLRIRIGYIFKTQWGEWSLHSQKHSHPK